MGKILNAAAVVVTVVLAMSAWPAAASAASARPAAASAATAPSKPQSGREIGGGSAKLRAEAALSGRPIRTPSIRASSAVPPGGTWAWQNPAPNGNALNTISCPTTSVCFAAGDNGPILATTDGGASWTRRQAVTGVISLSCGDASFCIGLTSNAQQIRTTDGGATWTSSPTGFGQLYGVSCVLGTHTCMAVGDGSKVAELSPSVGEQDTGAPNLLFAIDCSSGACVAVGYNGTFAEGLGQWRTLPTGTTSFLLTVSCGVSQCVAGGTGGVVLTWDRNPNDYPATTNIGTTADVFGSACPQATCLVSATDGLVYVGAYTAYGPEDVGSPGVVWSISCPSAAECFVAGDGSFIASTGTGGTGWRVSEPAVGVGELYGISCPSTSMCVAAGFHGARTTDGGATWAALPLTADVWNITCPSTAVCYAVGGDNFNNGGFVFKTSDGGSTWSATQIAAQPLYAVSCTSTTACMAGGANGELATTSDGSSWTSGTMSEVVSVRAISCASATSCMAITYLTGTAQSASIEATTDGATWTSKLTVISQYSNPVLGLKCPSTTTCYAVGRDDNNHYMVWKTIDAGTTWSKQTLTASYPDALMSIDCLSLTHCFTVAHSGDIYSTTDGSTWTIDPAPHGIWYSVSCAAGATTWCFAVDFFGTIARTENDGAQWLRVFPNAPTGNFAAVSCSIATNCFAVTRELQSISYGEILSTSDGGATWVSLFARQGALSDPDLGHIACPTASACYATESLPSAGKEMVVSSTDGGATWSSVSLATSSVLTGIACADATHCFVGDAGGGVMKTIDGATWSARTVATTAGISALSCPTVSNCVATDAANPGHVYATADAGAHWALSFNLAGDPAAGVLAAFDSVSCSSPNVCTAVGNNGLAATTTDGGRNWRTDNVGAALNFTGVSCPSDDTCFASTNAASILRSTDWGGDWVPQFSGVTSGGSIIPWAAISCVSAASCHAVGLQDSTATGNGGAAWTQVQPIGRVNAVSSISCTDSINCYAGAYGYVGPSGIQTTHDGGATWAYHTVDKADTIASVSCPAANTCFASGWPGALYFSGDGGTTWTYQANPLSGADVSLTISCPSASACYAVGTAGHALRTTDGGATWTSMASGTTLSLFGISCGSVSSCVAVGVSGITDSWNGTAWHVHASGISTNLDAVSCPAATTCFTVGRSGRILATTNAGATWTSQSSGVSDSLYGIQCTSSTGCLAAGNNGAVVYTLDGTTWSPASVPSTNLFLGVAFLSPGVAWLVGASGTILQDPNLFFLCLTTVISSDRPSPQAIGSTITFTASNPGGCNHVVEFWLLRPGGSWTIVQAFSPSGTWSWNTAGLVPGTYYVGAWSRDGGSPNTFDSYASTPFVLQVPRCSTAGLSAAPSSPITSGPQVLVTATSTGCAFPLYEFWLRPASSSTWQMVQGFSPTSTLSWSSSMRSGTFYFGVWVKASGSTSATFEANAGLTYVVNQASCGSATLSSSVSGTSVTFTAQALSCSNPNPLYEFWFLNGSTWQVVQAWSPTATLSWSTSGKAPGTYHFGVWVRDASSAGVFNGGTMGRYDATAAASYTVT